MEELSLHNEVVSIAYLFLNSSDIFAWESRNDAVNEGSAYVVVFLKPLLEAFVISCEIIFPKLYILADAIFEVVTIEENELARHDDKAFLGVALKSLIAAIEELNEFARVRRGRSVSELTSGVEGDTCLGGVRNHKANFRLVSESHESCVLAIRIERTANDVDSLKRVDGFAIQAALQVNVIEAILAIKPFCHTAVNRLNNSYRGVEIGLLVHVPDNPIYECAEEITFAKLNDFLGSDCLGGGQFVKCFHNVYF